MVEMPTTATVTAPLLTRPLALRRWLNPGCDVRAAATRLPTAVSTADAVRLSGYQMPGYYQQPMGYPPMGMYPQQMMPTQPMPVTATVQEPAAAPPAAAGPEIRLPDPESTGAKAPEPKPTAPAADGSKPASIRDTAADIINKYRTRPPAG